MKVRDVRRDPLGTGASNDGQLAWPGCSMRGSTLVLAAQKRAVHVGQQLQEMPVEGSVAIAGPGVRDSTSDWTLRTTKLARVQDPMQAKKRTLFEQFRLPRGCG